MIPVPKTDLALVKNLDVFTPIVDEPFIMGQIAACNVTSDIFAMNVPEISGMLIFLAVKTDTPIRISEGILKGIKFFMEEKVNSRVVGGHTIFCEWPLIGGEASGFVQQDAIIRKQGVRNGDKLILTKPLGLQAIMASYRILREMPELLDTYSVPELQKSIDLALKIMITPNQAVIKAIHSFNDMSFVHAMTDVTGFGLAGHLQEMLQHSELSGIIEKIPAINLSQALSQDLGYAFDSCRCHETSGGILLAIDSKMVEEFTNRLSAQNIPNWIVGTIHNRTKGNVSVAKNVEIINITEF